MTLPPSALAVLPELLPGVPACLIIAGEACPPDLAARWQPGRRFVDAYGPTETTVCASALIYEGGRLTIGRPIAGFDLYVADRGGQLQPPGVPGELLLGGPALARGYIGRPDLTAEHFVPHSGGVRLYRTGDLARTVVVERDGVASREIELRGRIDHQVKIRGFRIELGEIETVLAAQAGVREAAVVVREDAPGDPRLVAYLTGDAQTDDLRQALRERLPEYMVPSAFVILAALPLTPNGKVDRKSLPAPDRQGGGNDHLAPRTPVEEILAGIWAGLLGIERAGSDAHFFDLGGHSLLATQMISHLRDAFGVEMPLRVLFEAPVLADLAARIEEERRAGAGQLTPPLIRRPEEGPPPLSFAQQRLWFIDQLEPGSPVYNLPVTLRIAGPLDSRVLALCLGEIARRHETLRTVFATQGGSPVQVVRPAAPFALPVVDLSDLPELALRLAREEAIRPFDLEQGPLLRGVLLRLDGDEHVIALTLHHIVSDGWSMGILVREVTALYQAFAAGRPSPLPELPLQYADFAAWQHSWLHGEVLEEEISFWRGQLAGLPPLLDLPTDRPRPVEQSYRGAALPVLLPAGLSRQAADLARREGATLFMVLLAAFQALLARTSGQDDLTVGSPVAGRNRTETEGLIGFFVNTLVLRGSLSGVSGGTFRELLGRSRETLLEAWRHQDVPFEKLVQELAPERSLAHTPLFQVMLALQNVPAAELSVAGLGFSQVATETTTSKFDLTLTLAETSQGLAGSLEYAVDLFDPSTVERFLRHLAHLLADATADPETPVSELRLMDVEEERQVLQLGRDRSGRTWTLPATVHGLYMERAERTPDRVAAIGSEGVLTHGEIAERSAALAGRIRSLLPYPLDRPVALLAEADAPVLAGMLGILRAGAGFVPLDPRHPDERLAWVLQDAACEVLVTPRRHLERAAALGVRHVLCLEDVVPSPAIQEESEPRALAYIVYTSGSTGRPKGVQISHENLVPILLWGIDHLGLGTSTRVLQSLSICFDFGIFEHLTTLLAGGTLVFPGEEAAGDPFASARVIVREGIDTLHTTPALAREIATAGADLGGLAVLHLGGEALSPETVSRLHEAAPRAAIFNGYGPTEASVNCAIFRISETGARWPTVPIGRPSADNALYVLDRTGQPVPFGVRGDLHVGGIGVARGYLNRPDLTAERFVPDPFGSAPGGRLYRTGDLVRYRATGDLEFLGRLDLQVKIRGFRIELEEIETALLALRGVQESVVLERSGRLVAYLVGDVSPEAVRGALRERLPDYMVPSAFVVLPALPLTPNGKVDRKALPAPEQPASREGYTAPRTRAEEILAAVWAQVLRLPRVGVDDNFFELGGDSILSIQIVARARQAGLLFTVRQVFEHQTVAELARHATATDAAGAPQADQGPVSGEVPLTPIQRWFFAQGFADPHHFNQALLLEPGEPLSPSALERATAAIVEHHDALRLRFHQTTEGWRQENAPAEPVTPFSQVDLSSLPEARLHEAFERAAVDLQGGFDLSAGPLTRLCLFSSGEGQPQRLLWVAHHLVVDGVSWRVLVEDLETACRQNALPPKTTSFQEWARRLTAPAIPSAAPSGDNLVRDEATVSFELDAEETTGLLQTLPSVYHSRIDEALLSALARALAGWNGSPRQRVDLERHGRDQGPDDLDVSRTVGWFTTLSPLVLEVGDAGPGDALVSVKERLRSPRPVEPGAPSSEISFNYLGQIDASFDERSLFRMSGGFGAGPTRSPRAHRAHALEVSGLVAGGRLRISLTYGSRKHGRESAEALAAAYAGALRELVRLGRESAEVFLRDAADAYPLTPLQSGMLFHSLMEPESGVYVNQLTCSLAEDLDPRLFRQVWQRLVARHDALRTAFLWEGLGEPLQVVRRHVDLPWQDLDWRGLPAEEQESRFEELRLRDRLTPLSLDRAPLMRFSLVRLDRGYGFIWTSHHLLMDGWSVPLLVQELGTVYAALREGRHPALPAAPPFGSYIAWLQRQDTARAEPFWRGELAGFTHLSALGLAPPPAGAGGGGELTLRISREVSETLQALAARHKVTLQTVVLGAWALLVSRYSCEEDVVFGGVVSGRPAALPGVETMIGLFINTLPVRTRVDGTERLAPWLQHLQERQLARRDFEHTPLAQIQRWSEVPAGSPLFDTLFVFENYPAPQEGASGGLGIGELRSLESTNYPYTLVAAAADQISLRLMYDRGRLGEDAAPRLVRHLATLLSAMAAGGPERRLDELEILTPEEALQLRTGDEAVPYRLDHPLHAWIEDQAARSPEAPAVVFEGATLTYRELDERANRLAHRLIALGAGPERRVALFLERSAELIVALLAVLKSGAAYLPLDPDHPAERIAFQAAEARPAALLTQAHLAGRLPVLDAPVLVLTPSGAEVAGESAARPEVRVDPDHPAYVLYTSGSTGRPKGVAVPHRAIVNRLLWMQDAYRLTADDRVLQKTPFSFDVSVWELFWPLMTGARLVVALPSGHRDNGYLARLITGQGITVLHFVPSMLQLFLEEPGITECRTLRDVVCSGEALPADLARRFAARLGHARLHNLYGPTEAAVDVTFWACEPGTAGDGSIPIGRPIANTRIHLLDPGLRPVPEGVAGELFIAGVNLARGYLERPGLTAERFLPDPLGGPGERVYRTGDLARRRADGAIEFLGRLDHQVKIRGFRIELGEIEAALVAHPRVREAVVVARDSFGQGDRRLIAYLVADGAGTAAPTVEELQQALGARLPDYMVPAAFMVLESFPLTPSGKVDRKVLPEPGTGRPDFEQPFVAPATPEEETWAAIWREVLGVDRIGVHDNFFALGGDSIHILRVLARARERGLSATLQQIYQRQTIHRLLEEQGSAPPAPSSEAAAEIPPFGLLAPGERERLPAGIEDAYPLARLQAGMVFHSEYSPETAVFHDVFAYHVRSPLDLEALHDAVRTLAHRHAVLRTSFLLTGPGEPLQLVHREVEFPVGSTDLRHLPPAEQQAALAAWIEEERGQGFDWSRPPLARFHVHRRGDDSFQIALGFHHALLDGWSVASLFSELFQEYVSRLGQEAAPDLPIGSTFRDFVALEREALASAEQREHWRRDLAGRTATILPRWPNSAERGVRQVHRHPVPVSAEISEGIHRLASSLGVPVKSALLAAHLRVLQLLTGQVDLVTGMVANGRPETEDGARVLGLFLNTVPFRLELRGGTWRELVRQTFDAERERLPFRRFPLAEIQRMHGGQPLFEAVFNFVSFHVYASTAGLLDLEVLDAEVVEETNFPLGVNFNLDPVSSRLHLTIDWDTSELHPAQVEALAGYFTRTLAAMAAVSATRGARYEDAALLAPEETQLLVVEANDTQAAGRSALCVHHLFEEHAARSPAATALILGDERLTYGELNGWANRLAGRLRGLGVGVETVVGLCVERSFEAIAGILGVLKAGGAYLPLDPAYPPERLSFLLEDARVPVLLCQERLLPRLPAHSARVVLLDATKPADLSAAENPRGGATPLHPAYVIYTSGSTGVPKGVVALHGGLANFALAMAEEIGLDPSHRFLEFASLSFDASAVQIFTTLVSGATLVLHPDPTGLSSHEILRLCERHGVTVLDLPAALWRQFMEDVSADGFGSAPLSVFMTGGESVAVARLRSWAGTARPGSLFLSSYGPTEATVTTTLFAVTREQVAREQVNILDGRVIPLGRRLPNVQVHLLDRHVQPVPTAVPGEICIGGAGITRGYLGRPDLTAEAFTPDPFSEEIGARLYRTGDMARRLPDGRLEFLGRFDHQVKVRGFRVEPGEIEAVLASFPEVAHAAVVIREDSPGDVRLVAYVVPQPEPGFDLRALRGALQEKLPPHMVPTAFVVLDALPVTAHGKLDRMALPAPDGPGPDGSRPYREPRTPVERKLAEIWAETLRIERPGLDDSFFELGGHSLVAVQMAGRLREVFRIDLSLRTLYEAATLAELAAAIEGGTTIATLPPAPPPLLVPDPAGRFLPFPLTPVQQAYWIGQSELFELGGGGSNIYNEIEITGSLRVLLARLTAALPRWIERHDSLRTVVLPDGTQQVLERMPRYVPEVVDLRGLDPREVRDRLEVTRDRLRSSRLVAGNWPPFEIVLFPLDGGRLRICARISALILDGTGRGVLMQDLYRLVGDPNATLPPVEVSFRDYALARVALRDTEAGRRSRDFWMRRLPGLPPAPDLPRGGGGRLPARPRFVIRELELLDAAAWSRLRSRAARAELTPTGAVLAAFVDVLAAFAHTPRFTLSLVGTEHLPLHPRIGEVVGNFNTIHLLEVDGWEGPFETRARRLRDRLVADQEHPYFSGLEALRELNRLHGNRYGATMPVLFNSVIEYSEARGESSQDGSSSEAHNDDFRTVELNIYTPQVLFSPTVMESPDGKLLGKWQAVEDAFPPGLISGMAAAFESRLHDLADREDSWQAVPVSPLEKSVAAERLEPRDAEEEEVASLWRDLLGTGDFGVRDDFFAAGGDSFGIVRLVSGLEDRLLERNLSVEPPPRHGLWRRLRDRFARSRPADSSQEAARSLLRERLMAAFVQGPTVENLAAFVRRERAARAAEVAELAPATLSTAAQVSMRRYLLLWFSQFVSGVGTGIGSFALGVWIYRQNASATQYSLFAFVATCTALLVAPLAGVLADRWDRKRLILFGDSGAAVMTGLMALALYTNQLQLWHVYIIAVFMVGFSALQGPALVAATSMLVPRDQLGRVSGLAQAAGITTGLICPPLSGALVPVLGYHGVIAIDIVTFLFAFTVLLFIPLPSPPKSAAGPERRSFLADFAFGWAYLRQRPGLLQLLWVFAATNFALSIVQVLLTPLVLSFGSASNLGFVNMATAAGGLLGSVVLTIWGGPRNRIGGILLLLLLQAPILLLGALQPHVMLIAVASFAYTALSPLIGGLSQTIWQTKVAHDVQGRVFAMRGILVSATAPLAFLLAGPLADRVFEPLMAPGGALAGTVGQLIGVGKGRGVGLLFITLGLFTMLVVLLFSRSRRLRKVETEIPDA